MIGSLFTISPIDFLTKFCAANIICCFLFLNKGYWYISLIEARLQISLYLSDELNIKTFWNL